MLIYAVLVQNNCQVKEPTSPQRVKSRRAGVAPRHVDRWSICGGAKRYEQTEKNTPCDNEKKCDHTKTYL